MERRDHEALKAFATWTAEGDEIARATAQMLESGELEVVDIIEGEFVLRTRAASPEAA